MGFHFAINLTTGLIVYSMVYMLLKPQVLCLQNSNWVRCDLDADVCPSQGALEWRIDWSSEFSLTNWITRLDLYCADQMTLGLFGFFYFVGILVSAVCLGPLGDIYGRLPFIWFGQLLQLAVICLLLAATSVYTCYVGTFLLGLSFGPKGMIAYTHLMEYVPGMEKLTSGALMFIDGVSPIVIPMLFQFVTADTNLVLWLAFAITMSSLVVLWLSRIPESTKYLLLNQNYEQARGVFSRISSFNSASNEEREKIDTLISDLEFESLSTDEGDSSPKSSPFDSLRNRKVILNLVMMVVCWSAVSFSFYMLTFFLKYLPGNIYTNSTISGFSCIGYFLSGYISTQLGTKQTMIGSFLATLVAALTIALWPLQGFTMALVLLICRTAINCNFTLVYVIHIELFPTSFIVSSFSVCNFMSRLFTTMAPMVAEAKDPAIPKWSLVLVVAFGLLAASLVKGKKTGHCEYKSAKL